MVVTSTYVGGHNCQVFMAFYASSQSSFSSLQTRTTTETPKPVLSRSWGKVHRNRANAPEGYEGALAVPETLPQLTQPP